MSRRLDLRLAGAGGQGVALAGRILAEAALRSGREAAYSQAYGPASRGGASHADVVIAAGEIGWPLAESIGVLVAVSGAAYAKYAPGVEAGTTVVADTEAIDPETPTAGTLRSFPIVATARRIGGGPILSGVVALGVLQGLVGLVDEAALEEALASRVPSDRREMNLRALVEGRLLANGGR